MNPGSPSDWDHPRRATQRIARNTIYLAGADVLGKVMAFLFFMLAARHLGVQKFGVFSFALAYTSMFSVFTDLGLGVISAREIARDRGAARLYVSNSLTIKLAVSAVLVAIAVVSVGLVSRDPVAVRTTRIVSPFILTSSVALYYGFVFQGFERMGYSALVRLLQAMVLVAGAWAIGRGSAMASRYAWLYLAAGCGSAIFAWLAVSIRFVSPGLRFDLGFWRRMLGDSLPVGFAAAFAMLYYWNGSAFLARMSGDTAVGLYNAPFRLVLGLSFAGAAYTQAVYPAMSRMHVKDPLRLREMSTRSVHYMIVAAVPLAVIGGALARPVILLLYGSSYLGSIPVLAVLVWWGAFMYLNQMVSQSLYSVDRPGVVTAQTAVGLGVNLVLNVALIPQLGALGAAISIAIAEAVGLTFLLARQARTAARVEGRRILSVLLRSLVASLPAALAGWLVARWAAVPALLVAAAVYVVFLFLLRGLRRRDLAALCLGLERYER